jgi:hypothetical protein
MNRFVAIRLAAQPGHRVALTVKEDREFGNDSIRMIVSASCAKNWHPQPSHFMASYSLNWPFAWHGFHAPDCSQRKEAGEKSRAGQESSGDTV